jgi:protein TonB
MLGTMKTIHKKTEKNVTHKQVKDLLVEDPAGHRLLSRPKTGSTLSNVSQLIELKKVKDRKIKSTRLLVSSISLCLSLIFAIGMFEWKFADNGSSVDLNLNERDFEDLVDVPQTKQIQKPPVQVQTPMIIEVANEEIIEEIEINLDIEMTEDTRIEEVIFEKDETNMPEERVDEIFVIVEEQPMPKGGLKEFYNYVSKNLKYPTQARRLGMEGRVFVEFIVERDGSLTDIKVVKGIGAGCDEEAIRVIAAAPKWNPGKQRGREVRVRMIMPIVFKLLN